MPVPPSVIQIDPSRDGLFDSFGLSTLEGRYLLPHEKSPQEALARASAAFADDAAHAQRLYDYVSRHWFMFATPLLSNGGTTRGLPISCFLNYVSDDRDSILANYTENGWLASMGGGIGTYWSAVRGKDEKTSSGSKTSGVIPFMSIVDRQMLAFNQGITRRGSAAVYLDVSHPEIEEFLNTRKPSGGDANRKLLNLHNGVCIPDRFMMAVDANLDWDLIDPHSLRVVRTVSARLLWRKILEVRAETGEPYLFFSDNANRGLPAPLKAIGLKIHASNLCCEIYLPTGPDPRNGKQRTAVCCLSSVNLEKWDEWKDDPLFIPDLMRMLDNTLDAYIKMAPPSHAAAVYSAQCERSVGLGAMGLHSLFQARGIAFESAAARALNVMIFAHMECETIRASLMLGAERGEAPDMAGTGHRFAHRMALAPNASSGIICGNVSPSIEPRRANAYLAKTLAGSTPVKSKPLEAILTARGANTPEVWKSIIAAKGSVQHLDILTDHEKAVFKTAIEIDQLAVIKLAADRQHYIDQGQSINLFVPADVTAGELHEMHRAAWAQGVKGLYYLRSEALKRADLVGLKNERRVVQIDDSTCVACEG